MRGILANCIGLLAALVAIMLHASGKPGDAWFVLGGTAMAMLLGGLIPGRSGR